MTTTSYLSALYRRVAFSQGELHFVQIQHLNFKK